MKVYATHRTSDGKHVKVWVGMAKKLKSGEMSVKLYYVPMNRRLYVEAPKNKKK